MRQASIKGIFDPLAVVFSFALLLLFVGAPQVAAQEDDQRLLAMSWDEIVEEAKGQTVHWWMWAGDAGVNQYVDQWVGSRVKEKYGINLKRVAIKDTAEGVQQVVQEKNAGKTTGGAVDLNWISGENLLTMKQGGLLFTGYRDKLPNAKYINWEEPVIKYDRAIPVEGAAIAWGRYQQVMSYDSAKIKSPPKTFKALGEWIKANPGKFTYPAPPDFTGRNFIMTVLYEVSGGAEQWAKEFNQALWDEHSPKVWKILNEWKPNMWRRGETHPETVSVQDQLFASGELAFSSSMYYSVPGRNVAKGMFPKTTRTMVFDVGTISAAHVIGIPFNSSSKAAAIVLVNFLISPAAQYQKALPDVWGIGTVLDMNRLSPEWKEKFTNIPRAEATLSPLELDAHKSPAPHSKYHVVLEKEWRENVLKK